MAANNHLFAVRALPASGIDGAFRIHILQEHLDQLNLKIGDVCAITNEDVENETLGIGLAWRAAEKMNNHAKTRPVKMTPTAMENYGIKEGTQVKLSKVETQVSRADEVTVTDVTSAEHDQGSTDGSENGKWYWRCGYALANSEAFARGMTFEVSGKKGIRKRFYINEIRSSSTQSGAPALYYCDDETKVTLADEASTLPALDGTCQRQDPLSPQYIGGLQDQVEALNMRLRRATREMKHSNWPIGFQKNSGILIHGFEGTGKSLLLKRLEHAKFRKVICLNQSTLTGGGPTKNHEIIAGMFREARAKQPSLILIDNIEKLAPVTDDVYGETIANELEKLQGARVLVIAACRSPTDLNSALLGAGRLSSLIELPIPDLAVREQILKIALREYGVRDDSIANVMSRRTHGFTGKDLASLVEGGGGVAIDRFEKAQYNQSSECNDLHENINGDIPVPAITIQDLEIALTKVRPTALREIIFEPPNIKWDDIGGSRNIQKRFNKIIEWPLHYAEDMIEWRMHPKKGVLLYGPPGCSKTLTAQAVATMYGLNFIAVKGAELISMYVGESERAIRETFRKARAAAPCVIFFDEIDSIASERDSTGTKGLNVLTTLLNEMDGFNSLKGVLVLAATNKPEAIDPAIMRPGRFDSHFYLGPPDAAAREKIFAIQTKGLPMEDLDYGRLVDDTEGYTGAEIVHICDLAKDEAWSRKIESATPTKLGMMDFEKGLEQTKKAVTPEMLASYQAFAKGA